LIIRRSIAGAVFLAAGLWGCFLVTGSTDGYAPTGNAGAATTFQCASSADCDAGQVCCLGIQSTSSASSQCQAGPCALAQLCTASLECGDAAPGCALQSCMVDGSTYTLQACGALAYCAIK
jgi:hypothetical protein